MLPFLIVRSQVSGSAVATRFDPRVTGRLLALGEAIKAVQGERLDFGVIEAPDEKTATEQANEMVWCGTYTMRARRTPRNVVMAVPTFEAVTPPAPAVKRRRGRAV